MKVISVVIDYDSVTVSNGSALPFFLLRTFVLQFVVAERQNDQDFKSIDGGLLGSLQRRAVESNSRSNAGGRKQTVAQLQQRASILKGESPRGAMDAKQVMRS